MLLYEGNSEKYVHIWRSYIDLTGQGSARLSFLNNSYDLLSPEEKHRSKSIFHEKSKKEFIFNRSLLRIILSKYLKISPKKIEFKYNKFGKPELKFNLQNFQFNISHSSGYSLIAVTQNFNIGIDIEENINDIKILETVDHVFAQPEIHLLKEFEQSQKLSCFYDLWTMKEALLKAEGTGLSNDPIFLDFSSVYRKHSKISSNIFIKERNCNLYKIETEHPNFHAHLAISSDKNFNYKLTYMDSMSELYNSI